MKGMKKVLSILTVFCMLLALTGCGAKEQKASCVLEQNGVELRINFEAKGDVITKMTQISTIHMDQLSDAQVEAVRKGIEQAKEGYASIDKVDYSIEDSGTLLVETITINTDAETIKALSEKKLLPVQGSSNQLSLKNSLENFEKQGYTIEKDS